MKEHYVYILECFDKTFYTGWTSDVEKRLWEHNNTKQGAKYTQSRRPVELVYLETCKSLSDVLRREAAIKKLTRIEKIRLIDKQRSVR